MNTHYDVIIIGAGHNGLVAGAALAKAGKNVLILEQRSVLGGIAATEEIFPGFQVNVGADDAGLFRPEIIKDLGLHNFGLEWINSPVSVFSPRPNGEGLTIWRDDVNKTQSSIQQFSEHDAKKYPQYLTFIEKMTGLLKQILLKTPPDLFDLSTQDIFSWLPVALGTKRLGDKDMMEFIRLLPMGAREFLDEWFESDILKGALGCAGVSGSMQGPYSSGTALMLLYQQLGDMNGGFKSSKIVKGGTGKLSKALGKAAQNFGAEIKTSTLVERVIIENSIAVGVQLSTGEQINAKIIASNADPRYTLFDLVGAPLIEPRVMRKVRNIRFRGSTAKILFALNGLPNFKSAGTNNEFLSGHIIICPSLEYLEYAYDDAKRGDISSKPYLSITIPSLQDGTIAPEGNHLMSITFQYAPHTLREGNWDSKKEILGQRTLDTLETYCPNIKEMILQQYVITPIDLEKDYNLTEGSIYHGQMGLDQMLFMRPIPGYGQYKTQIENLYLCGAGAHPGGGVTGAPGYNAAHAILRSL